MSFMAVCRTLAVQESRALRGFCRAGVVRPYRPIDYWAEWQRLKTCNESTFT